MAPRPALGLAGHLAFSGAASRRDRRRPTCFPGLWRVPALAWLRGVELDLDADSVGDAGQVAGVAGDDGGLVADGGGDDDRVHDVGGGRGGAGHARGAADALVIGDDVAA